MGNTFELLVRVLCNENVTMTVVKLTCSYPSPHNAHLINAVASLSVLIPDLSKFN